MKKNFVSKTTKNEIQSHLFNPLGQWTGNNFLFKNGLREKELTWLYSPGDVVVVTPVGSLT